MSFDWPEFLILAKKLAADDEPSKRSAISRSYYAAFCTARDRLIQSGIRVPQTGKAHETVPDLYALSGDFDSKEISKNLVREKLIRNSADYDLQFQEDLGTATERSLARAEKIVERVQNMPERIIDEIKAKM